VSHFNIKQSAAFPFNGKVPVGMEGSDAYFGVLYKIQGPNNSFLTHIEKTANAQVQLRGLGSGFLDPVTKRGNT
jgi:hypothetical protein